MLILHQHLNNCEESILAQAKIPGISGHSLHKGTPREIFVKEFLAEHLPLDFALGTGEVIDYRTEAGGKRNQIDLVIFRRSFPRVHFGGQINAFMRESVIATIEVKSTLSKEELTKSVRAGKNLKDLKHTGQGQARPIASYVVAYDGAAQMETVFGWLREIYQESGLRDPELFHNVGPLMRENTASASIDGVYLLGVGACIFENNVGLLNPYLAQEFPETCWSIVNCDHGALAFLFAGLLGFTQGQIPFTINPYRYLTSFAPEHFQLASLRFPQDFWLCPLLPKAANTSL